MRCLYICFNSDTNFEDMSDAHEAEDDDSRAIGESAIDSFTCFLLFDTFCCIDKMYKGWPQNV